MLPPATCCSRLPPKALAVGCLTAGSYPRHHYNLRHIHAALTACTQNTSTTNEFATGTDAATALSSGRASALPAATCCLKPQPNHVKEEAAR